MKTLAVIVAPSSSPCPPPLRHKAPARASTTRPVPCATPRGITARPNSAMPPTGRRVSPVEPPSSTRARWPVRPKACRQGRQPESVGRRGEIGGGLQCWRRCRSRRRRKRRPPRRTNRRRRSQRRRRTRLRSRRTSLRQRTCGEEDDAATAKAEKPAAAAAPAVAAAAAPAVAPVAAAAPPTAATGDVNAFNRLLRRWTAQRGANAGRYP